MIIKSSLRVSLAASVLALTAGFASAQEPVKACLITKTDINPFFVKMKEGAAAKAEELGIELMNFAGKIDGFFSWLRNHFSSSETAFKGIFSDRY